MTQNVRGAYVNFTHDRAADWEWLHAWEPNVIRYMAHGSHTDPKSVDVNRIRRIHETCPEATILMRVWDVDDRNFEAHNAMVLNPGAEAAKQIDWWAALWDRIQGVPRELLMAGLNNETGPEKDAALYRYTEEALRLGTLDGIRLGVYVFSVGRPALAGDAQYDIPYFERLDKMVVANQGAVLLHEYFQPEGMYAVWTDEQGNERKDYTYLVGRHLRWKIDAPIIIGEWGIDGILYNRHPDRQYGNSGWRNFKPLWPPARYADEYVECVRKSGPNVIGICPFIEDWADHKWQSFDLIDAYAEFLARKDYCVRDEQPPKPEPPKPQPPDPTPEPPDKPGSGAIMWPVHGPITDDFGTPPPRFGCIGHNGVDIACRLDTPVLSPADGMVMYTGEDVSYGNYCRIWHKSLHFHSFYAHLNSVAVRVGQRVARGQTIALSGSTGNSTGPHLHYELRGADDDGNYVDVMHGYTKGRFNPRDAYLVTGSVLMPDAAH